jgi:VCBS repeat-containing protein
MKKILSIILFTYCLLGFAQTNVSGGAENGTQQVTINHTDNDLPSVSSITIDKTDIDENGGVAVITATISAVQSKDVIIPLTVTGTATINTDYSINFDKLSPDVVSIYSDNYTNINVSEWNPDWGQTTTLDIITDGDNNYLKYSNLNYSGIVTNYAPGTDISSMNYVHFEYKTDDSTKLGLKLVNLSAELTNIEERESIVYLESIITTQSEDSWISVDIPLSSYTNDTSKVMQLVWDGNGTVNIDNLFFYKENIIINIPSGASIGIIKLTGIQDSSKEDNETIIIKPSTSPTNATSSISDELTVTIVDENFAPVATVQTDVAATEQTEVTITLAGTDSNDDTLTYIVSALPTNGTLSDNGTVITTDDLPKTTTSADVVYVSTSDTAASDSFTFKVNDGTVDSEAATVSIVITAVNDAPLAVEDTATVLEDAELTSIDVITNDINVDENTFPAYNGNVFITELADPNGSDDIGSGYTRRYIELYNAGPSSVDLTGYRIDRYKNGNYSPETLSLTGSISAGEFYIITTGPENSDFFNTWGITPNQWDGTYNFVAGGNGDDNYELYNDTGNLIDQFGVPGEDGTGTNHEYEDGRAERKIGVIQGNSIWDVDEWDIDNDEGLGDGPLNTDESFDPGSWIGTELDILKLTAVSTSGIGTVDINADGLSVDYTPAFNFNGTETITYTVSDGELPSATGTLTITVTAVNDAPLAVEDTATVLEDAEFTSIDVITNDTDVEEDSLTLTAVTTAVTGTIAVNEDGVSVDYTPALDFNGTEVVTYTVSDGTVESTGTLTIAVTPVNDAPTITSTAVTAATEDVLYSYEITTDDIDGDIVTLSSSVLPSWLTLSGNTLSGRPLEGDVGEEITITATDNGEGSLTATQTFIIVVTAVNDAPVALADTTTVDEGNTSTTLENGETSLLNNDTDAENNPLTAILVSDPIYGSLTLNSDGTFSYEHDGSDIASDYFTYKVNDGELDSNTATVIIIINTVNDTFPTDIILSNNFIDENLLGVTIGQFTAEDLDLPADIHTFELVSGIGDTNNTSFTITDNNLIINESFDYETQQSLSIRVKVIDEVNQSFERSFDILINNVNDISITSAITDSYCSGTSGTGSITISSIDDTFGNLTFAWSAINGGSIPSGQETIQSLTEISDGTYSVTISDTSFSFTESFEIGLTPQYDELSICYVSSDETDETKNRIFLNNAGNYNVGIYEILRETNSANIYTSIGSMLSTENSFLDENSDNMSQSYNYKVRLIDYCGNQSPNSDFHKTILLQSSVAVNNSVNLNWSDYEGTDYGTYNIFRNTNSEGFNLIGSVSASNNSFNDAGADITIDNYEYYISISVDECLNDVSGKSNSKSSTEIKSNRLLFSNGTASVDDFNNLNQLVVFPNPSNDMLNIKLSEGITLYKVKIYNTLGQMVLETQDLKFSIENLASSTYFIKIFTSKGLITRNFIKN